MNIIIGGFSDGLITLKLLHNFFAVSMQKRVTLVLKKWLSSVINGGFQLLDLIIPELKSHVIPHKFKSSHWLKLQHSDWRANLVKDFFLQINFPPMRALEFIRDHVTFEPWYNQI